MTLRVAFVYPNPRAELIRRVAAGDVPDTNLLGQNHMAEHGIDAFVYDSRLRRRTMADGVVHRVTWYGRELTLPWELREADVIVTPLATFLPLAARVLRRPRVLVLSYHLVSAWERAGGARRRLLQSSVRSAAGIAAVARAARERIVERLGTDPRRTHVAQLGVDETWWQPLPPEPDGHVLTVGRDLARDYETFARALDGLPVRGVIVAKAENVRDLDVPSNVDVRLNIRPAEVRDLYARASCVVVPTRPDTDPRGTENSGTISLLEAMACARPTITTERLYLRDYVHDDATATVSPQDPDALRAAIEAVLADAERAAAMGRAAREHVEAEHTTRRLGARLAELCKEIGAAAA
jgi:glycosyltransferase involved in cell wall biosynthesis